ncbi:lipoprotein pyruvate-formate lyase [Acetobacter indonesiensis]|uniref:lipoprotein pyruvate-formate lyase n=1 Tax=Acetobacter indonesiensis TaxID=104101 RepID=UPI0020A2C051|nr:lipoprotein pyruvate-formate lyase [Acetobacter indonesiensis]MCP1229747.1 lipoprotein pyruvate-formate lyase [Acetobacter indonesiensis]
MPLFLPRRSFCFGLAGSLALPSLANAHSFDPSDVPPPALETLKWAPKTRAAIQAVINEHGHYSENYDVNRRPYAVFDWDETAIVGNVQDTLFHYMLDHFSFLLPTSDFRHLIHTHASDRPLPKPFTTIKGKPISLSLLVQDILEDYSSLAARYGHLPHPLPRETIVQDAVAQAFRARMVFFYQALRATHGGEEAQRWLIRLLAGQTITDVLGMTRAANEWGLGQSIGQITLRCPEGRAGEGGTAQATIVQALRLTPEMSDLFQILQEHGIDPIICTSSLEDCTAFFATSSEYGYNIRREHVFGARLDEHKHVLLSTESAKYPFPYGSGKTAIIHKYLIAKRQRPPLMIFAGEDSSAHLLSSFPEASLCCLINRKQSDTMQPFLKEAARLRSTERPRLVLQGRDENTGEWLPEEASIFLGETEPTLP